MRVRLTSLIAYLRTRMRVPIRQIYVLLHAVHGCEVRMGERVEVLHRISTHARPVLDDLTMRLRGSGAVHADDTGWREDGRTGFVWSVCTPTLR